MGRSASAILIYGHPAPDQWPGEDWDIEPDLETSDFVHLTGYHECEHDAENVYLGVLVGHAIGWEAEAVTIPATPPDMSGTKDLYKKMGWEYPTEPAQYYLAPGYG